MNKIIEASGAVFGHAVTQPVQALRPRTYAPTGGIASGPTGSAIAAVSIIGGMVGSLVSGLAIGAVIGALRRCPRPEEK